MDDEEGFEGVKAESSTAVKAETVKTELVKDEPTSEEIIPDFTISTDLAASTDGIQYAYDGAAGFNGVHDSTMFDDFLRHGGSIQPGPETSTALNVNTSDGQVASGDGRGIHESILITD